MKEVEGTIEIVADQPDLMISADPRKAIDTSGTMITNAVLTAPNQLTVRVTVQEKLEKTEETMALEGTSVETVLGREILAPTSQQDQEEQMKTSPRPGTLVHDIRKAR